MKEDIRTTWSAAIQMVLPAIPVILLTIVVFAWFLPGYKDLLVNERKQQIRSHVKTLFSILDVARAQIERAGIDPETGKQQAIDLIKNLKVGPEGEDYFWVHSTDGTMIFHPNLPELNNQQLLEIEDKNGVRLFAEMNAKVAEKGWGYVRYFWQKNDQVGVIEEKISYVEEYEPWGWVVGTGIYIKDLNEEIQAIAFKFVLAGLVVIAITTLTIGYLVFHTVKSRKRHEVLRRDKDRLNLMYEELFQFSNDALILLSAEKPEILKVNRRALELFEVENEEAVLGTSPNLFCPETQPDGRVSGRTMDLFFASIARSRKPRMAQWQFVSNHGTRFTGQVSASVHEMGGESLLLMSIRDISEMTKYQKSLEEMQINLENRLQDIEHLNQDLIAFDYSVNNALLTPIRHITGYADILREEAGDSLDTKSAQHLNKLVESTQKLHTMVRNLRQLSKATQHKISFSTINLSSIVRTEIDKLRSQSSAIDIDVTCCCEISVSGDHELTQMLISQILDTLIAYSSNEKISLRLDASYENGIAEVRIVDDQWKFDAGMAKDIFLPFRVYQYSSDRSGPVLGLSTAAKIVQRHGGKIHADKTESGGTAIVFTYPA